MMKPCIVAWCCALAVAGKDRCVIHLSRPEHPRPPVKRELVERFKEAMGK